MSMKGTIRMFAMVVALSAAAAVAATQPANAAGDNKHCHVYPEGVQCDHFCNGGELCCFEREDCIT